MSEFTGQNLAHGVYSRTVHVHMCVWGEGGWKQGDYPMIGKQEMDLKNMWGTMQATLTPGGQ